MFVDRRPNKAPNLPHAGVTGWLIVAMIAAAAAGFFLVTWW